MTSLIVVYRVLEKSDELHPVENDNSRVRDLAFTVASIDWQSNAAVKQQQGHWKERHWKGQVSVKWRQKNQVFTNH